MKYSRINRIISAVVALAVLIGGAACSSKKQAAAGRPHTGIQAKRTPEAAELAGTYREWTSFYAPMSFKLSKPANFGFSGRATMEYGKYIHLSLRMLGLEVGVVYVDNDSAYVLDKYHKVALAAPLSDVTSRTSITLADLQGMLMGQAVYPGEGVLTDTRLVERLFSAVTKDNITTLTPRKTPGGSVWYFTLDPGPVLSKLDVEIDNGGTVEAVFSQATATPAGTVAADVALLGTFGNNSVAAAVDWNLDKAEWNGPRTASKPSLDGYRILKAEDLLKNLKF